MDHERLSELVGRARNGDVVAFAELVETHRPRTRAVVARIVGDGDEAEDVVQEALLRAYLGLTSLREPERFGAWLIGIALNLARMTVRRRSAYARALARVEPRREVEREELTIVREAIELLPAHERDAVVMHYVDDLSCEEIARILDSSPGAVRVRLHRARERLRAELAPIAPREPIVRRKERTMIPMRVDDVLVRMSDDEVAGDQRIILLREEDGERVLPIWVGSPEGNQLASALHRESTFRPMTSDLLAEFVQRFGGRVERVAVTRLEDKTFYATITLGVDGRTEDVDARPSDALNLAVRVGAPIYVDPDILESEGFASDEVGARLDAKCEEPSEGEWRSLAASEVKAMYRPPRLR
jgi:RNA polymerase sigma factor (sigma-70 family)